MLDTPTPQSRLSEVSRLATLLSDQVLDAQIMKRPIPDVHVRALLDAALLLEEYGRPLPPLLGQIMHEVGADARADRAGLEARDDAERSETRGMAWLLRPFRGER